MGRTRGLIVSISALMFLIPAIASAANCGGATACGCTDTITSDYTMTSDLTCPNYALDIGADGITLDCDYHTITGPGPFANGIMTFNNNIHITNCEITNFADAIMVINGNNVLISNFIAHGNDKALFTNYASNVTISNVTFFNNVLNIDTNSSDMVYHDLNITDYDFKSDSIEIATNEAEIEFEGVISASGSDLSQVIVVKPNNITINTNIDPSFNKPANLTLYNVNYNSPKILKDGADCPEPQCYILSYDSANDILRFNVTGFSSYSAGEGAITGATTGAPGFEFGLAGLLVTVLVVVFISASGLLMKR